MNIRLSRTLLRELLFAVSFIVVGMTLDIPLNRSSAQGSTIAQFDSQTLSKPHCLVHGIYKKESLLKINPRDRVHWEFLTTSTTSVAGSTCPSGGTLKVYIPGAEFVKFSDTESGFVYPTDLNPPQADSKVILRVRQFSVKKNDQEWLLISWNHGIQKDSN